MSDNIHEYQAKRLLERFGVNVPKGEVAWNPEQALEICGRIGGPVWVAKAQVHAGGRGKAGGVKLLKSREEVQEFCKNLLGTRLVTFQTDEKGQPVNQILIEEPCDIAKELYLGMVVDREAQTVTIMASTEGGVEIEEVAHKEPEKIIKVSVDFALGLLPYQCREIFFHLQKVYKKLDKKLLRPFSAMLTSLYEAYVSCDMNMLEINPLVITANDELIALDCKVGLDGNALYRHNDLAQLRDPSQEDERENAAQKWELNYISLQGNIGCMVNGAGLAMATMDLIKLHGGQPANFLDVGGGATRERVAEAFKIIVSDEQVQAILVNIFGGIVRCDLIADGIISAVQDVGVKVPVVVRLQGNNAELGMQKLEESGLNIHSAEDFTEAAAKVVSVAQPSED